MSEEVVRQTARELFPDSRRDQAYFIGLAKQESGFNPKAYNAKGDAYGLFQFAGDMRRAYGMDLNSPEEVQAKAGADYIGGLYKKHGGDWTKVLAEHYMGGPRFKRSQEGKTDAEVRSFYASHLPKVQRNAMQYGAGGSFEEDPPVPQRVASSNIPADVSDVTQKRFDPTRWTGPSSVKQVVGDYVAPVLTGPADFAALLSAILTEPSRRLSPHTGRERSFSETQTNVRSAFDKLIPGLARVTQYEKEARAENPEAADEADLINMIAALPPLKVGGHNFRPEVGEKVAGPFFHALRKILPSQARTGGWGRPRHMPKATESRPIHAGTPAAAWDRVSSFSGEPGPVKIHELTVPTEGLVGRPEAAWADPGHDYEKHLTELLKQSGYHSIGYQNTAEDVGSFSVEAFDPKAVKYIKTHGLPEVEPPYNPRTAKKGYHNWLNALADRTRFSGDASKVKALQAIEQVQKRNPAIVDPREFSAFMGEPPTPEGIANLQGSVSGRHQRGLEALLRGEYDKARAAASGYGTDWANTETFLAQTGQIPGAPVVADIASQIREALAAGDAGNYTQQSQMIDAIQQTYGLTHQEIGQLIAEAQPQVLTLTPPNSPGQSFSIDLSQLNQHAQPSQHYNWQNLQNFLQRPE